MSQRTPQPAATLFDSQVSGKLPKYTNQSQNCIYKKLSKRELAFYQQLYSKDIGCQDSHLKAHVPRFMGVESLELKERCRLAKGNSQEECAWIDHISRRESKIESVEQFLVLGNILIGQESPCVIDIKLGKKLEKKESNKKFKESTTNSHNFRINGMKSQQEHSQEKYFISKYYFQKTTEAEIQSHLAFFFYDGHSIDSALLTHCITRIKQIVFALLGFRGGSFHSSSLLIAYDGRDHSKVQVKLIDFDKYFPDLHDEADHNVIDGLKYIVGYLYSILERSAEHEEAFRARGLKFFNENEIVPEQKQREYEEGDGIE